MLLLSVEQRLEKSIMREPNSGCWLWTGAVCSKGYGNVRIAGRLHSTHRLSYETFVGPIPDGLHVLHRCDCPPCIRPDHLFLGTNADNKADSMAKDRHNRGERHGKAKLTDDQIAAIRASRETNVALAERYGIAASGVSGVRHGVTWKHLWTGDRGQRRPRAKLNAEQARAIRVAPGTYKEIAAQFGVGKTIVGSIKLGQKWKRLWAENNRGH